MPASPQSTSNQQGSSSKGEASTIDPEAPKMGTEEWSSIKDPSERRKIQNKLAQRRYRDKAKEQKEEAERNAENHQHAASAYTSPQPEAMDSSQHLSGLPWGGISMKHIAETGKNKEQNSQPNA